MDAQSKSQMAVRIAIDIESIGVRELGLVAIGGGEDWQRDLLSRAVALARVLCGVGLHVG